MADKEPRRRRRRKDLPRKDDSTPLDSHTPQSMAPQSRDSDPDIEEEPLLPTPSHEPSKIAQVVFVILSVILVAAMSTVFVALHGTQRDLGDNGLQISEPFHVESEPMTFVEDHIEESDDTLEILVENFRITQTDDDSPDISDEPLPQTIESEDIRPTEPYDEPETIHSLFEAEEEIPATHVEEILLATEMPEHIITEQEPVTPFNLDINEDNDDEGEGDIPEPIQIKETLVTEVQDPVTPSDETTISPSQKFTEDTSTVSNSDDILIVETTTATVSDPQIPPEESMLVDDTPDQEDDNGEVEDIGYEKADITNFADFDIKEELDGIEKILEKSPEKALQEYEDLLQRHPTSPRGLFGKASALDQLAEIKHSNKVLEEAIATYQKVLEVDNVPDALYLKAGKRCVERMTFRGFLGKSLKLLLQMSWKFPNDIELKNKIAVGYLMIGQNKKAKETFVDVIEKDPNNGFAKVHLGFILKTDDSNYEAAIPLLTEGIASREAGVLDGRFFFQLGDALTRVGQTDEALKVYEQAVKENLFLSVYQRSLYNVQGLTGKPWWETQHHKYSRYFDILEEHWEAIKKEALDLKGQSHFTPENENLQDKGEWEQFEIFIRGKRVDKNCAAVPFTCSLIEKMPDAATCKRGQVKFSIMQPGTHVWAHTGPTNCRLRAHLGLVVPNGVRIRVANETRTWEEGKVLLFDDSFEHEVWHEGSEQRLVLIIDFWHPELTPQQRASLSPI